MDLAVHSSLEKVLKVVNLASINSTQCPELSFYAGGRGCQMILYTPYHMIYTQIRLAIMWKNDWSSFVEGFDINYVMTSFEFLLATLVSRYTINLFRVRLMVICKESQLNTMVSIYRYKRKMTHCLGYPVDLASLEWFTAKLREGFLQKRKTKNEIAIVIGKWLGQNTFPFIEFKIEIL